MCSNRNQNKDRITELCAAAQIITIINIRHTYIEIYLETICLIRDYFTEYIGLQQLKSRSTAGLEQ